MTERINHTFTAEYKINPYPGLFIVIEGLDGSGNSTQIECLRNYFTERFKYQKGGIQVIKEPTYGPAGASINWVLRRGLTIDDQTLQLMFIADRSDDLLNERTGIVKFLKTQGNVVLGDRYIASTPAFGNIAGLDKDWLLFIQSKFILPDYTFFLDVKPHICMERINKRNNGIDRFEKLGHLEKAYQGYGYIMRKIPDLMIGIDGERPISDITKDLISYIEKSPKLPGKLHF